MNRRFGVEIEMVAGRAAVAVSVAETLAAMTDAAEVGIRRVPYGGDNGDCYYDISSELGTWRVKDDPSIGAEELSTELVTPPLTMEHAHVLEEVVRTLESLAADGGVAVTELCGIHVHTDAKDLMEHRHLGHLLELVALHEGMICEGIGMLKSRRDYASRADGGMPVWKKIDLLDSALPGRLEETIERVAPHRYMGFNLRALLYHGTVEYRWFNTEIKAESVQAFVDLALHLSDTATERRCDPQPDMLRFLDYIGMGVETHAVSRAVLTRGFSS